MEISEADYFSATTDLWSSHSVKLYTSYTIHLITNAWQLKAICLLTLFLPEDHIGTKFR